MLKKGCKQCRHVKFKGTMPKWPAHKTPRRNRHSGKNLLFVFFGFSSSIIIQLYLFSLFEIKCNCSYNNFVLPVPSLIYCQIEIIYMDKNMINYSSTFTWTGSHKLHSIKTPFYLIFIRDVLLWLSKTHDSLCMILLNKLIFRICLWSCRVLRWFG